MNYLSAHKRHHIFRNICAWVFLALGTWVIPNVGNAGCTKIVISGGEFVNEGGAAPLSTLLFSAFCNPGSGSLTLPLGWAIVQGGGTLSSTSGSPVTYTPPSFVVGATPGVIQVCESSSNPCGAKQFTINDANLANNPPTLTGGYTFGVSQVFDQAGVIYVQKGVYPLKLDADYSDGTKKDVTGLATWTSTSPAVSVNNGVLNTTSLSANTSFTVNFSYTQYGKQVIGSRSFRARAILPVAADPASHVAGPESVGDGSTAAYAAYVVWDNGGKTLTPATWSASQGTISTAGLFTAPAKVIADVVSTITATYHPGSDYPDYQNHTTARNIIVWKDPAILTITGPAILNERSSAFYAASVTYDDGTQELVQPTWSLTGSSLASIGTTTGILNAPTLTGNQPITLSATFTYRGKTVVDTHAVTLTDLGKTLIKVTVSGPQHINESSSASYTATATFDDGSSAAVTPVWSIDADKASIDSKGVLSVGTADGHRRVAVSATYTLNGIQHLRGTLPVVVYDTTGRATEGASADAGGLLGGSDGALGAAMSADGRFVAFASAAALVAGDSNGFADIYVRDRQAGTIGRVSLGAAGVQSNANSFDPSISADGRFVVFSSIASNLVANDTNGMSDVFVHDRQAGITKRLSASTSAGVVTQANGASDQGCISGNGLYVAFASLATNLVSIDANAARDVFVHDITTGVISRVSVDSFGTAGNGESTSPCISSDGRFVVFQSNATNLIAGDINGLPDILVHDRWPGTGSGAGNTIRVSGGHNGVEPNGASANPSISADGQIIAFSSAASNLVVGDDNNVADIFVRDSSTGQTKRISVDNNGAQVGLPSQHSIVSGDGRFIVFSTSANALVPDDNNNLEDIFVHDRWTGIVERVSVSTAGVAANGHSTATSLAISNDGRTVVLESLANNLVSPDVNVKPDIFVRVLGQAPKPSKLWLVPAATSLISGNPLVMDVYMDFAADTTLGGGVDILYDGTLLGFSSFVADATLGGDIVFTRVPQEVSGRLRGMSFGHFNGLNGVKRVGALTFDTLTAGAATLSLVDNEMPLGRFFSATRFSEQSMQYQGVSITITAGNNAPLAKNSSLMATENTSAIGALSATDPDGNPLTYSVITNGAQGTVTITNTATGAYTYVPKINAIGNDAFTFKANDGKVNSNLATVTVTINPLNDPPVAHNGNLTTTEGVPVAGTLSAMDPDSTFLTYFVVNSGAKGVVNITNSTTGAYSYTPNANVSGIDSFTFKATDGVTASNTATVVVTIAQDTDKDGIVNTVDTDDDNDGMPDAFEIANGLDPLNAADALSDADKDGISNLKEYQAGLNPKDPSDGMYFNVWTKSFGGPQYEQGSAVALDGAGNVYLVGFFQGTVDFDPGTGTDMRTAAGSEDVFITRINVDGSYGWTRIIGSVNSEIAASVAVDAVGNVYVGGSFTGTLDFDPGVGVAARTAIGSGTYDAYVVKLTSSGNFVWVTAMGSVGNDDATALAIDAARGALYMAGTVRGSVNTIPAYGKADILLARLNANDGAQVWAKIYGGVEDDRVGGQGALVVDGAGNLYLSGFYNHLYFGGQTQSVTTTASFDGILKSGSADIFVLKIASGASAPTWVRSVGGTSDDNGVALAMDTITSGIYLAGYFKQTVNFGDKTVTSVHTGVTSVGYSIDAFLLRLNVTDGTTVKSWIFGGKGDDRGAAVAVDAAGSVYISGSFFANGFDANGNTVVDSEEAALTGSRFLTKITSGNNYAWIRTFNAADSTMALYSPFGSTVRDVYVLGHFSGNPNLDGDNNSANDPVVVGGLDVFLAKFAPGGSNKVPVATSSTFATNEDVSVNGMVSGADADGDPLAYSIVGNGTKGAATIVDATSGAFVYVPSTHATGVDTFTFQVGDGLSVSNLGTVTINIAAVNDAPIASNGSISVSEDFAGNGILVATDVDSSSLSYSILSNGIKGTVTLSNAATGAYTYVPNANANGVDTFSFQVSDGALGSNIATITVNINSVNDAPLASGAGLAINEDMMGSGTLSATDVDGDALTYNVVANGVKGAVTVTNTSTGAFVYTPNLNANGVDTFTFKASDGIASSNVAAITVNIAPVNDAPVAIAGVLATSEDIAGSGMLLAVDADGDALTYRKVGDGTKGGVTITNPSTGAYTYTPLANVNGSDTFAFMVNDGKLDAVAAATINVTINPVNDPPVANNDSIIAITGVVTAGILKGTDIDGNALTYSIASNGLKGTAVITNPATGAYTYTPGVTSSAVDSFTFKVSDSVIASNAATISIAIDIDTDKDGIGNVADVDDDNDGMPDSFELANGFDPLAAGDATLDADLDGFTNLQEYQKGTNPKVSNTLITENGVIQYGWTKSISANNPSNSSYVIGTVTLDATGNVYLAGSFNGTVDFDPGVGVDSQTVSPAYEGSFVTRINVDGSYGWTRIVTSASNKSIVVDGGGNIYVGGYFYGSTDFDPGVGLDVRTAVGSSNAFVAKLSANGAYAWTRIFPITTSWQGVSDLAVDSSGALYIVGAFTGDVDFDPGTGVDMRSSVFFQNVFITKLNGDGTYVWTKALQSSWGDSRANAVAVDAGGNLYLTGEFTGQVDFDPGTVAIWRAAGTFLGSPDAFVLKLNAAGDYVWSKTMGSSSSSERGSDLVVDGNSDVYVAGNSPAGLFVMKLNAAGADVWMRVNDGGNLASYDTVSIALDKSNSVYVSGSFVAPADFDPTPGGDYFGGRTSMIGSVFVTKLKSNGSYGWTQPVSGVLDRSRYGGNAPRAVVDGVGNIYLAGSYSGTVDFNSTELVDQRSISYGTGIFLTRFNIDFTVPDTDKDGVADARDVFPGNASEYIDTDGDGTGNSADTDADNDTLPNQYELGVGLSPVNVADAALDQDKDGLTSLKEYQLGTHPMVLDSDGDRMADGFEVTYGLNPLSSADAALDMDMDGLANLDEYWRGTRPNLADTDGDKVGDREDIFPVNAAEWLDTDGDRIGNNADLDDDNDRMPDGFEIAYAFDPLNPADAALDTDGDTLTNLQEYQRATHPRLKDMDADGVNDNLDVFPGNPTEWLDFDRDGVGNNADLDDDNDGMPDSFEMAYGLNPFSPSDSALDSDADGMSNLKEYQHGTNPNIADAGRSGSEHVYAWTKTIGGAGSDYGRSIVDGSGNIYIFGRSVGTVDFNPDSGTDFYTSVEWRSVFLTKLDGTGRYLWTKLISSTSYLWASTMAADKNGNIYIAGMFDGMVDFDAGAGTDYRESLARAAFLTKINANGSYGGTQVITGGALSIASIAFDTLGNIYYAGEFGGTVDFNPAAAVDNRTSEASRSVFLTKLGANMGYGWTRTFGGANGSGATAYSVAVDASGNVLIAGQFIGTVDFDPGAGVDSRISFPDRIFRPSPDIFVTKVLSDGAYAWTRTIGGLGTDAASSVAVDATGHAYVAGTFWGAVDFDPGEGVDIKGEQTVTISAATGKPGAFLVKINTDGSYGWSKIMLANYNSAISNMVTLDAKGNVYLAGIFADTIDLDPGIGEDNRTPAGGWDIFITKLNADGSYGWGRTLGGTGAEFGYGVAVDHNSHVYVAGSFTQNVDFDSGLSIDLRTSLGAEDIFLTKIAHCPVAGVGGCP